MLQFNDRYVNGVVLSFDLKIKSLEKYYSKTSPKNAYKVIRNFLEKNGFVSLKDSDYLNKKIDDVKTSLLLIDFSLDNKWLPLCVQKMNISPNVENLDISDTIKKLCDII